jgi:hypothetical protein
MPLILSINLAFMLPVATPTNSIVIANDNVRLRDMVIILSSNRICFTNIFHILFKQMTTGIFIKLFGISLVFLATVGWLGAIFNLDPTVAYSNTTTTGIYNNISQT